MEKLAPLQAGFFCRSDLSEIWVSLTILVPKKLRQEGQIDLKQVKIHVFEHLGCR